MSRGRISSPVIISGIFHAERFEDGGSILDYAQYLESLAPNTGFYETGRDTDRTMERFLCLKKVEQFLHLFSPFPFKCFPGNHVSIP